MTNSYTCVGRFQNFSISQKLVALSSALLLIFSFASVNAYANGEISFVSGKAQIISSSKEARTAGKGSRIIPGETIQTGADGEVHAIMDDNTILAVRANSSLKIEDYVANGDEKDRSVLFLLRGQLRSITGWIGKIAPRNYAIRTPTATIGIRGTDHEVAVIEQGNEAGTYDKVNTGETILTTPKGEVSVQVGKAGFAKNDSEQPPVLLKAVPPFYQPTPNEELVNKAKAEAEKTTDERLKQKQNEIRRDGGLNAQGHTKISNACANDPAAMNAFNEFIRAYELGNVGLIQNKLDPAMIGYQRFVDGVIQDSNRLKQMRISLKDTQLQCGPDITVIQTLWEKRYLDVNTFSPGLFTGRATILMHRDQDTWKFVAVSGDNLFASLTGGSGTAPIPFRFASPGVKPPSTIVTSAPTTITGMGIPAAISIVGGSFSINGGPFTNNPATITSGQTVAVRLTSSGIENGVAIATVTIGGVSGTFTVTTWDVTPNALPNFNNGSETNVATVCAPLISNALTVTGITAPVSISVSGSSPVAAYSINGRPFTATPGTVNNGDSIRVRANGLFSLSGPVLTLRATLLVAGNVPASFSITCF